MVRAVVVLVFALLALSACEATPERARIAAASTATDARGGLEAGIGIAAGSRLVPVLERGCRLPCTASQTLRAAAAGQDVVAFQLYQGRDDQLANARALGTYRVSLAGRGPQASDVELTFTAEPDGALVGAVSRPDGAMLDVTLMR